MHEESIQVVLIGFHLLFSLKLQQIFEVAHLWQVIIWRRYVNLVKCSLVIENIKLSASCWCNNLGREFSCISLAPEVFCDQISNWWQLTHQQLAKKNYHVFNYQTVLSTGLHKHQLQVVTLFRWAMSNICRNFNDKYNMNELKVTTVNLR